MCVCARAAEIPALARAPIGAFSHSNPLGMSTRRKNRFQVSDVGKQRFALSQFVDVEMKRAAPQPQATIDHPHTAAAAINT